MGSHEGFNITRVPVEESKNDIYFMTRMPDEEHGTLDWTSWKIIAKGGCEPVETSEVFKAMRELKAKYPDKKIAMADIGVHIGWYTLNAVARGYKAYAVEAFGQNRWILKYELCFNDPSFRERVVDLPFGLGEKNEYCVITSGETNIQNGGVVCGDEKRPDSVVRESDIEIKTLDS